MGIENASVIDFMGLEDSTGKVVLTIADEASWGDDLMRWSPDTSIAARKLYGPPAALMTLLTVS